MSSVMAAATACKFTSPRAFAIQTYTSFDPSPLERFREVGRVVDHPFVSTGELPSGDAHGDAALYGLSDWASLKHHLTEVESFPMTSEIFGL